MEDPTELEATFNEAADAIRESGTGLDNDTMLRLYGLYKQSTQGPCNVPKPGLFQFTARAKWDAWNNLGSLPKSEAMNSYIELVNNLTGQDEQKTNVSMMGVSVSCLARTEPEMDDQDKTIFDWLKEGDLEHVQSILKASSSIANQPDESGMHLIHWAADRGDLSMLRLLVVEHQSNANVVDSTGQTPLHYAYACGHEDCIQFLMQCGADPHIRDEDGNLPCDLSES